MDTSECSRKVHKTVSMNLTLALWLEYSLLYCTTLLVSVCLFLCLVGNMPFVEVLVVQKSLKEQIFLFVSMAIFKHNTVFFHFADHHEAFYIIKMGIFRSRPLLCHPPVCAD